MFCLKRLPLILLNLITGMAHIEKKTSLNRGYKKAPTNYRKSTVKKAGELYKFDITFAKLSMRIQFCEQRKCYRFKSSVILARRSNRLVYLSPINFLGSAEREMFGQI